MVRIRYKPLSDGSYISNPILVGHDIIHVVLNEATLHYSIRRMDGSYIVKDESCVSSQMLRIQAKKMLKELGASFDDEIRKPFEVKS